MKSLRITLGSVLAGIGVVFFILPGSILFLIAGLLLLSYDVPAARKWLTHCQNAMSKGARKLDKLLAKRRY
ncbi:tellurium resistance protein TerC [Paraneptunicella aestuarii]|uniref:tellurium resistance protein TerC n=1 Tax=Paraneptunicella aestuarii TaxID=2831148 RepID=UPI001E60A6E4|nr:tellurium resistance protein TerC [Paraneptunicella aestuarii]UAA40471.1 tellurium resistance protein TerC [Paraneptunicella aestuarii]